MVYYQHFIGDYRRDTRHLTLLEHGAYRELLDQYYLSEEPIPLDESKLMRLLSARQDDEQQAIKNVLNDFFVSTDRGYIHKRCDIEIAEYHSKSQSASANAKARWKKEQGTNANGMQTQCELDANGMLINNHKSIINNHKSIIIYTEEFEQFWKMYPNKTGKGYANKCWDKKNPDITLVLKALEWQIKSKQWLKNNGEFIPLPSTYLNQDRWLDEPPLVVMF